MMASEAAPDLVSADEVASGNGHVDENSSGNGHVKHGPDTEYFVPQPRITNPVMTNNAALKALFALSEAAKTPEVPSTTVTLVHLRASQINGCSYCVEMHARELKEAGESEERITLVAAWREAPCFTRAERAALALTEAATCICNRPDAVSDEVWNEAAECYNEEGLASLVLEIAAINTWNRINVTTRQTAGAYKG